MIHVVPSSRQPQRAPWTMERLIHERAVVLGSAIKPSSKAAYSSALQSYIYFCSSHCLPIEPTIDTLSFFVVYMCYHIKPQSVKAYLSGICNQLEPFYPEVRELRRQRLVTKDLSVAKNYTTHADRKRPLTRSEIGDIRLTYQQSNNHDDLLFVTILSVGFHALMRLGELVWPDKTDRKVILRNSVQLLPSGFSFFLPRHKGDHLFEGNRIIIQQVETADDPVNPFRDYLRCRDLLFPFNPELWLRHDGSIPTRHWFINQCHRHFTHDVGGHSLHADGASFS